MRTDGRADEHDEANSRYSHNAKARKNAQTSIIYVVKNEGVKGKAK